MSSPIAKPKFLAVDFYCGAGGTTRGLIDAGGYVICGIDKEESYRSTYQSNNPNSTLDKREPGYLAFDMFPKCEAYPQGQQDRVWSELRRLIPYYRRLASGVPLLFVICAPCQSFTKFVQRTLTTNRTESRDRDRDLLSQTVAFVEEFQPEMINSENVASIKTGVYRHIWNDFQARFALPEIRSRGG